MQRKKQAIFFSFSLSEFISKRNAVVFITLMHTQMQGPNTNDDFLKQMLSNLPPSSFWSPDSAPSNAAFAFSDAGMLHHHLLHTPLSFHDVDALTSTNPPLQPPYTGSLQPPNHPQGFAPPSSAQPKQRMRARRGQATDPHSIAERLRRERIAERMKALQELVPNANKTDKASMLDEIIDYVKFLQLQVKVLSMSRLGGGAAVAPLVADMSSEGGAEAETETEGKPSNESLSLTEQQVAKLMEEDMGSAMQYLQGKGLCLMPISLATAISKATSRT